MVISRRRFAASKSPTRNGERERERNVQELNKHVKGDSNCKGCPKSDTDILRFYVSDIILINFDYDKRMLILYDSLSLVMSVDFQVIVYKILLLTAAAYAFICTYRNKK